jgi:hypothetical protein
MPPPPDDENAAAPDPDEIEGHEQGALGGAGVDSDPSGICPMCGGPHSTDPVALGDWEASIREWWRIQWAPDPAPPISPDHCFELVQLKAAGATQEDVDFALHRIRLSDESWKRSFAYWRGIVQNLVVQRDELSKRFQRERGPSS